MKGKKLCIALVLTLLLGVLPAAAKEPGAGFVGGFADVSEDAYYADAVQWAVEKHITKGTAKAAFSPDQTCTQAQILTFLYRMHEKNTQMQAGSYYDAAAAWADEKTLIDLDELDPHAPCTRGDVLTYFWKLAGAPALPSVEREAPWNLLLVNPWNPIPKDHCITLTEVAKGYEVDERCIDALNEMLAACRDAGCQPVIVSAYRTQKKQETLFYNRVNKNVAQGMTWTDAVASASKVSAFPGTSEHQIGLALDIVDSKNYVLNDSQAKTKTQQWLMAHSWEYGFILRYPDDKTDCTGIIYEPWHYRYVGKAAAKAIYHQNLCLEEYLELSEQYTALIAWGKEAGITTNGTPDSFLPASICTRAQIMTFLFRMYGS